MKIASVCGTWWSRKTEEAVPPAEEESGQAGISGGCEMEKTRRRLLAVAFTAQGPEQAMAFSVATESARPPLGTAGILYIPKSVLFFFSDKSMASCRAVPSCQTKQEESRHLPQLMTGCCAVRLLSGSL